MARLQLCRDAARVSHAFIYFAAVLGIVFSICPSSTSSLPIPDRYPGSSSNQHRPWRSLHGRGPHASSSPPSDRPITISVPCMTIDLICPMSDTRFCSNVADSLRTAATRLTSAVQLSTTARVRVSLFSTCVDSTCPDTLAATVPSRSLTVWVPGASSPGPAPDSSTPAPNLTPSLGEASPLSPRSSIPPPKHNIVRDAERSSGLENDDPTNLFPIPLHHLSGRRLQADTSSLDINHAGHLVEYPQLVLRNLVTAQQSQALANSVSLLDHDYDVHMRLSADQHWWFPPTNHGPHPHHPRKPSLSIGPDQFDLTLVVLHELVHGLGFGGVNLMQAGNNVSMMLPIAELRTAQDHEDGSKSSASPGSHQEVVRFRAPSVFESLLATTSSAKFAPLRVSDLARTITSAVDESVQLPASLDQVNQALGHADALHAASTLYSLATKAGTVVFWPSSAADADTGDARPNPLVIETELNPLSPGSSLAHISQSKYSASPEFLMTYQIPRGKTLNQLIAAHGALDCGLGPQTLDALRSLGFRVHDKVAEKAGLKAHGPLGLPNRAYVLDRVSVSNLDAQFVPLTPGNGGGRVPGSGMNNSGADEVRLGLAGVWLRMLVAGLAVVTMYGGL